MTDKVGYAADLVEEGRNGFVVPAGDIDALADRIARLGESLELCRRFGGRERALVEGYGVEQAADGIVRPRLYRARAAA